MARCGHVNVVHGVLCCGKPRDAEMAMNVLAAYRVCVCRMRRSPRFLLRFPFKWENGDRKIVRVIVQVHYMLNFEFIFVKKELNAAPLNSRDATASNISYYYSFFRCSSKEEYVEQYFPFVILCAVHRHNEPWQPWQIGRWVDRVRGLPVAILDAYLGRYGGRE